MGIRRPDRTLVRLLVKKHVAGDLRGTEEARLAARLADDPAARAEEARFLQLLATRGTEETPAMDAALRERILHAVETRQRKEPLPHRPAPRWSRLPLAAALPLLFLSLFLARGVYREQVRRSSWQPSPEWKKFQREKKQLRNMTALEDQVNKAIRPLVDKQLSPQNRVEANLYLRRYPISKKGMGKYPDWGKGVRPPRGKGYVILNMRPGEAKKLRKVADELKRNIRSRLPDYQVRVLFNSPPPQGVSGSLLWLLLAWIAVELAVRIFLVLDIRRRGPRAQALQLVLALLLGSLFLPVYLLWRHRQRRASA